MEKQLACLPFSDSGSAAAVGSPFPDWTLVNKKQTTFVQTGRNFQSQTFCSESRLAFNSAAIPVPITQCSAFLVVKDMQFYNPQGGAPVPTSSGNQNQNQGFYGGNSGNNGNNSPVPDYLKNVSPEMINFGLSAGQDMLNKQRDKWMPGVSGFWHSLKYYFLVRYDDLLPNS